MSGDVDVAIRHMAQFREAYADLERECLDKNMLFQCEQKGKNWALEAENNRDIVTAFDNALACLEQAKNLDDAVMLIQRMARRLGPDVRVSQQATDWLKRKGLCKGSVLRSAMNSSQENRS